MIINMKKIITAINNPELNEELKKVKNFEIIGKDLLYKEAILEILEKNNNIDIIILGENLMGEIKLQKLIEKIKETNEKIKIIFILEKENSDLKNILLQNKIIYIYYNKKNNLEDLAKIINEKEINEEKAIVKATKGIKEMKKRNSSKIITFSGSSESGKTTLSIISSFQLAQKNNKVLLIEADLKKQDISLLLNWNVEYKKIKERKYKINFNNKYKKLKRIGEKIYYYKIKNELNIFSKKINNNLYLLKQLNHIINNNVDTINIFFKIIKQKYDFIFIDLSKENFKNINKIFLQNSHMNFIFLKSNLLDIQEVNQLLKNYLEKWNVNINSFNIILNKKNIFSINRRIIEKNLFIKNKIIEIKKNKLYFNSISQLFENNIFMGNKKDVNKIIKEIISK